LIAEPYFKTRLGILYHGDALQVLESIPNSSIDLIIADPPYFVLDTANGVDERAKKWDYFEDEESYMSFTVKWLNLCYNVLKVRGSLFVFWSERHLFLFKQILDKTRFKLYKVIVWHYPNILKGFSSKRWINTFDFIFHLVKGDKPKVFNSSFMREENKDVWIFPKPQSNYKKDRLLHPTQKPYELIERLVKMFSNEGETVLDPFMGSGTTALVCERLNRKWIGIEINEDYCKIIVDRIEPYLGQGRLIGLGGFA